MGKNFHFISETLTLTLSMKNTFHLFFEVFKQHPIINFKTGFYCYGGSHFSGKHFIEPSTNELVRNFELENVAQVIELKLYLLRLLLLKLVDGVNFADTLELNLL